GSLPPSLHPLSPNEVGEGPCRRSLRRREVGGKRSETGLPGPAGRPLPAPTTTPPPPAAGPFPPRFAPGDKGVTRLCPPTKLGEGPCRRSLRRREVGGKF